MTRRPSLAARLAPYFVPTLARHDTLRDAFQQHLLDAEPGCEPGAVTDGERAPYRESASRPSSAAVSPDAAVLITASAHGPALPLPCATAADDISRSAA